MVKRIGLLILFSFVGAIVMQLYHNAYLDGLFVKWELLEEPPSKVVKLIGLGYVQTKSGDVYQYTSESNCNNNCWLKTDATPDLHSEFWLPRNYCVEPSLDNYVDSIAICEMFGNGRSLTIDSIDKDGNLYQWHNAYLGGFGDFLIPYYGAFIGFIIGLFVLLTNLLKGYLRQQDKIVSEKE